MTQNNTVENKQTNGKKSFHIKDVKNQNEDPENASLFPYPSNTPIEPQFYDFPDIDQSEDNINDNNNQIKTCI